MQTYLVDHRGGFHKGYPLHIQYQKASIPHHAMLRLFFSLLSIHLLQERYGNIIALSPVSRAESDVLALMAITSRGASFISTLFMILFQR